MIPLKMMYYPDFFYFLTPSPAPAFQDFYNSGLKGTNWWQAPDCLRKPKLYIGCRRDERGCEGRGD